MSNENFVEEELPLKQGLKPSSLLHPRQYLHFVNVEEELPLKQGLKQHIWAPHDFLQYWVEEELPLKQGLKLPPKITLIGLLSR